jgi:hypothetical protein
MALFQTVQLVQDLAKHGLDLCEGDLAGGWQRGLGLWWLQGAGRLQWLWQAGEGHGSHGHCGGRPRGGLGHGLG